MATDTKTIEVLMKRCQVGVGGKNALNDAHDILAECYGTLGALVQQRDALQNQIDKLATEMLTPETFTRITEWLREDPPRRASAAFTAGIERQIAYAIETDVLPFIKSLRIQLANAKQEHQTQDSSPGAQPLPCPFCGSTEVSIQEGSTFRWRIAVCDGCGAQASEARHNTMTNDQEAAEANSRAAALAEWNTRAGDQELRAAARAVIERWDSPLWKDMPHTGEYIHRLRKALGYG